MTAGVRRIASAASLLAACGCATHDYGSAREARYDRPYQGGAANVPDERPAPTSARRVSEAESVGYLAFFAAFAIAVAGHASFSTTPVQPPAPPPPPSGR